MSKEKNLFHKILSSPLIHNFLEEKKLSKPTHVQEKIIPDLISGKSVDVVAPTGSGKTYSFLLPVSELLKEDEENNPKEIVRGAPRAIILAPTRELSNQIFEVMKTISHHVKLRVRHVTGGEEALKTNILARQFVDVVVSTPGKLSQAVKKKSLSLKNVKYFVIDEADQLLEMGFQKELMNLYENCDKDLVHIALFSATRPEAFLEWRGKIFGDHLFHFEELTGQNKLHNHVRSFNIYTTEKERPKMLVQFFKGQPKGKGVIFVNQQQNVQEVYTLLSQEFKNITFLCLHGEMDPKERRKVFEQFTNKKAILIATDIVARGMDVDDLRWVLNYDLPFEAVYYIHRAGRVGRLGKEGEVYNFVTPRDARIVGRINVAIRNQTALKLSVFDEKKFKPKVNERPVSASKKKESELKKIKEKMGLDTKKRIAHQVNDLYGTAKKASKLLKTEKVDPKEERKENRKKVLAEKTGYVKTVKAKHTPRFSRRPKSKKK